MLDEAITKELKAFHFDVYDHSMSSETATQ